MLDLSSFHGAAILVELSRMEGPGSGMGATGGRVISRLRFYCFSSGVETPLRKMTALSTKALPAWGSQVSALQTLPMGWTFLFFRDLGALGWGVA